MKLNSESILTLDANKTYYIANSTGEIKEAGLWQKFKCFFGVGDGRAKVQRLAEQVKAALLADGALESENTLNEEIGRLDLTSSISGAALKAIATRFRADNANNVAKADVGRIIETKVKDFVSFHSAPNKNMSAFRIHPDPQNIEYMTRLATMAAKSALVGVNVDANTDKENLASNVSHRLRSLLSMVDVAINNHSPCWENRQNYVLPDGTEGRTNLPLPVMNELSFKVFASCLFKPDGAMILGGFAGMRLASYPASLLTGEVKDAILKSDIPVNLAKTCNDALVTCFKGNAAKFSDFHTAVFEELRGDMISRYGSAVRKDAKLSSFGTMRSMLPHIETAVNLANQEGRLVRVKEIKDAILGDFCHGATKMVINDFANKLAAERNLPKPDLGFAFYMEKYIPEAFKDIQSATTPVETAEALKRNEQAILSFIEKMNAVNGVQTGLIDKAIDRIVAETGISRELVAAQLTTVRLESKAKDVAGEIYKGKYPGCNEKGFSVENALNGVLDKFVKVRINLLKEIQNEKNLSPAAKDACIRVVLRVEKPDAHHMGQIVNIATSGEVGAGIKGLKDALKTKDDSSIAKGLIDIGAKINAKVLETYDPKQWEEIGPDERDICYELLMNKIILDDEELAELLKANRDKVESWVQNDNSPIKNDAIVKKLMSIAYVSVL